MPVHVADVLERFTSDFFDCVRANGRLQMVAIELRDEPGQIANAHLGVKLSVVGHKQGVEPISIFNQVDDVEIIA